MAALSDDPGTLKFVHTYGAGLHSDDPDPDVHDPRWQRRQVHEFVEFAVLACRTRLPVWLGGASRPRRTGTPGRART
jgi:hypothetical protein